MPLPQLPGVSLLQRGQSVVLLHQGAGSTIDHFLRGPLEAWEAQVIEVDSAEAPNPNVQSVMMAAHLVVVVRYLPRCWIRALRQLRKAGIRLAYLMDDDLLDPALLPPAARPLPAAAAAADHPPAFARTGAVRPHLGDQRVSGA